jgi:hypothetical protein
VDSLPRHLGSLTQLQRLWMDWNHITAIPVTVKLLGNTLKELKVQGNPLVFPPVEVVVRGLDAVFEWTKSRSKEMEFVRKRGVVLHDCLSSRFCVGGAPPPPPRPARAGPGGAAALTLSLSLSLSHSLTHSLSLGRALTLCHGCYPCCVCSRDVNPSSLHGFPHTASLVVLYVASHRGTGAQS